MTPIIEVKNISKKYKITHQRGGYVALRDVITETFRHPLRYLKTKAKRAIGRETIEEFWALKDLNFTVEKGEAIGIIGANGAGKSTLLKILSKITPPTTGEIRLRGRVASLLEVGTGFHPELTGRENIFLNGAILGMTSKEIARKFDEIVKFSGVEKFLDTPVKRYSSGMYVRLAFAVAAHMEPEILIVDEVLAVGDAEFQKKCLGKMDEVARSEGRTVLFVSHNMSAIQALCDKVILLENGKIKEVGEPHKVISTYLKNNPLNQDGSALRARTDRKGRGNIRLTSFFVTNEHGEKVPYLTTGGKNFTFSFGYETKDGAPARNVSLATAISLENGMPLILNSSKMTRQDFPDAPASGVISCTITQKLPLAEGIYLISANLFSNNEQEDFLKNLGVFEVKDGNFYGTPENMKHSPIYLDQNWEISSS